MLSFMNQKTMVVRITATRYFVARFTFDEILRFEYMIFKIIELLKLL